MWKRVAEAAKLVGLSPDDLCERASISPTQKIYIQTEGVLSVAQVGRLSDKSGLPVSFYLQGALPTTAQVKLRHDFSADPDDPVSEDEVQYFRNRELFRLGTLIDTMLKTGALSGDHRALPAITSKVTAKEIAKALGLERARAPIGPQLVERVHALGVAYLVYPLWYKSKMGGASWWHTDTVPVIAVDSKQSTARSYFTLAHEVVHLIHHLPTKEHGHTCRLDPYITPAELRAEERFTNSIASHLLMPEADREIAEKSVREDGVSSSIDELAREWLVSKQALALRFHEWDLATSAQIRKYFVRPKGGGGKQRPATDRFGSPAATSDFVAKMYDGGASARFIEWAAKLPYTFVHATINKAEAVASG